MCRMWWNPITAHFYCHYLSVINFCSFFHFMYLQQKVEGNNAMINSWVEVWALWQLFPYILLILYVWYGYATVTENSDCNERYEWQIKGESASFRTEKVRRAARTQVSHKPLSPIHVFTFAARSPCDLTMERHVSCHTGPNTKTGPLLVDQKMSCSHRPWSKRKCLGWAKTSAKKLQLLDNEQ